MSLRALQQRFQEHLLNGASPVLADIAAVAPLSRERRLGVYRDAYGARLRDALKSNYPKLHRVLGDATFAALAAGFLAAHPSGTRSIRWFGRGLPEYLQHTPPYSAQPILAELARFEWALGECFDAADAVAMTREDLQRTPPTDWGGLRFGFHAGVRTLILQWNTVEVWKALDADPEATAPDPSSSAGARTWLLWRQQYQNRFRSLDAIEATALAVAMDGASFAQICEQLCGVLAEAQVPAAAAVLLSNWIEAGLLNAD